MNEYEGTIDEIGTWLYELPSRVKYTPADFEEMKDNE